MGTAFTTRKRTRFTAATYNPCLIRICEKRSFLLYGAIASQRALPSQQWALPLARTTPRIAFSSTPTSSSQAEVSKLVAAFFDDLVVVDPHVALAGEYVDVRLRFPVGVGLTAVGISERYMHARKFFILKQNADHLG